MCFQTSLRRFSAAAVLWGLVTSAAQAGLVATTQTDAYIGVLPPVRVSNDGDLDFPIYRSGSVDEILMPNRSSPVKGQSDPLRNILGFSHDLNGRAGPTHFFDMLSTLTGSSTGLAGITGQVDFLEVGGTGDRNSVGSTLFSSLHQTVSNASYCNVRPGWAKGQGAIQHLSDGGCSSVNGAPVRARPAYQVVLVDGYDWTSGSYFGNELLQWLSLMNSVTPTLLLFDDNGVDPSRIFFTDPVSSSFDLAWQVQQFDPYQGNNAFGQQTALTFTAKVPEPSTAWLLMAAALAAAWATRRHSQAARLAQAVKA